MEKAVFGYRLAAIGYRVLVGIGLVFVGSLSASATSSTPSFTPVQDVRETVPHLFDRTGLWTLGVGAGGILVARQFDEEARDTYRRQQRLGSLEYVGNEILGTGVPGLLVGAGFWVYGDQKQNTKAVRFGQASIEAIALASATTFVLKHAIRRTRPDESDQLSFPSGHSTAIFASAGVVHEFYGWEAGAFADLLGVITALARVSDDRHWLSDTAAGAVVGVAVGGAIARAHLDREGQPAAVLIYPQFYEGGAGLSVASGF